VAVLAVALATALAYWLAGYGRGPLFFALIAALLSAMRDGHRGAAVAALVVGYTGFGFARFAFGWAPAPSLEAMVALAAWLLVLYAAGEGLRVRRVRLEEAAARRDTDARHAMSEERLRIARELHDVLAHNIALINVQAATTLHRLEATGTGNDEPTPARDALAVIKQVSHQTLAELRTLVSALRDVGESAPHAPAPSLSRLDELAASAAASGVTATIEVHGTPHALPATVDLAAYRIVQEALTNVARHASTSRATVRVTYDEDALVVEIDDDGVVAAPITPGTGLTGMNERAAALGGTLSAGPRGGGGFRVRARLPVGSE
jgi:signal transduction histidine kinase